MSSSQKSLRSYVHLKSYRDHLPKEVADIIKVFEMALIKKECGRVVYWSRVVKGAEARLKQGWYSEGFIYH